MKRNDEEYLYNWYLDHKNLEFTNSNKNWLEILKKNFQGQNYRINQNKNEEMQGRKNSSNDLFHKMENKDNDYDYIPNEINNTVDTLFEKLNCNAEDHSIGQSFTSIQKSLKCPLIFMNKTEEIAMSLGVEQNQSSILRISTLLTPAASRNINNLVTSELHESKLHSRYNTKSEEHIVSDDSHSEILRMSSDQQLIKPPYFDDSVDYQTQGFKTDNLLPRRRNSLDLPTPELRLNVFKKLPINCTSTPVSHKLSNDISCSDVKDAVSDYREDSFHPTQSNRIPANWNASESFNTPKANSERAKFTVSRNILKSCEAGGSSLADLDTKIDETKRLKASLSYWKKKKKFVYPSSEEKISDDLAIEEIMLIEKMTEKNIVENVKEEARNGKSNISKQTNFMSACALPPNDLDNQDKYFNLVEAEEIENKSERDRRQTCQLKSDTNICHNTFKMDYNTEHEYNLNNKANDCWNVLEKQSNCLIKIENSSETMENTKSNGKAICKPTEATDNYVKRASEITNADIGSSLFSFPSVNLTTTNDDDKKKCISGNNRFHGFQSALGKKIATSSEALEKAKILWNDVGDDSSFKTERFTKNDKAECDPENYFPGFQSALGKKIATSSEAFEKAKTLWNDVDDDSNDSNFKTKKFTKNEKAECDPENCFIGFQSALGKKIATSSEALETAKTLWNDVDDDSNDSNFKTKKYTKNEKAECDPENCFIEFQSALGKKIATSSEALEKAKTLWNDVDDDSNDSNFKTKKYTKNEKAECDPENCFIGFQSALGKKIATSSEALEKAKTLWNDVDNDSNDSNFKTKKYTRNEKAECDPENCFPGFQSALGKNITTSSEALEKAKTLWNDIDDSSFETEKFTKKEKTECVPRNCFPGFQSALGKKIAISSKALEKAKTLWNNIEDSNFELNENNNKCLLESVKMETISTNEGKNAFSEFLSASGDKINISSEALTKSKEMLNDEFEDYSSFESKTLFQKKHMEAKTPKKSIERLVGFRPASDKKEPLESISNETIEPIIEFKAVSDKKEPMKLISKELIIGFKTANDKRVSVNPTSLLRAKFLFDEMQSDEENEQFETKVDKSIYYQEIGGNVSPILGSQKNRGRISQSQKRCLSKEDLYTNAAKILKEDKNDVEISKQNSNSISERPVLDLNHTKREKSDTEENMDINEITEAFLLDDTSWEDATSNLNDENISRLQFPCSSSIEGEREKLRTKQKKIIKMKMENKLKCTNQSEGALFQLKLKNSDKRVKLSSLTLAQSYLKDETSADRITSRNCGEFRFQRDWKVFTKLEFDDGVEVVPGKDHRIGWEEIESGFLSSSEINCSLVPKSWVFHHFSLIVWKLVSLQRRAGHHFQNRIFTLEEIIKQLRFRYDVEILGGKRSILRKIYEQDDIPRRTMVLCVSHINRQSDEVCQKNAIKTLFTMTLSDGWYNIGTQIDDAIMALLQKQIIKVGTKLLIHGAELVGNPSPCYPLQAGNETIQLKIHTNMCRLASWHSRLGLKMNARLLLPTPLSCILDNGGMVGNIEGVLCRKYPIAYMEKNEDKTTIISERLCETRMRAATSKRDEMVEKIYYQVEKEIEEEEEKGRKRLKNSSFNIDSLKKFSNGETIVEYLKDFNDPSIMQALSAEQLRLVACCKEKELSNRRQRIAKEVNARTKHLKFLHEVVPLLKLGVLDKTGTEAVITIWRPHEELLSVQEGLTYNFYYLMPAAARNNMKQVTWNKHSFLRISKVSLSALKLGQNLKSDFSILTTELDNIPFGEIDVVGIIIKIFDTKDGGQNVCLCDKESNFIFLRFSPSVENLQFGDLVRESNVISATNCCLKSRRLGEIATAVVTPFTIISSEIQKHFEATMINLKKSLQEDASFTANAENKLQEYFEAQDHQIDSKRHYELQRKSFSPENCGLFPSRLKGLATNSSPAVNRPFRTPLRSSKKDS